MKLNGRNLTQGMRGEDVQNLQMELIQLGFSISEEELAQMNFGDSTLIAVVDFQTQNGLDATGVVDAKTAEEMEFLLQVRNIVGEHQALVAELQNMRRKGLLQTARDLAQWSPDDWSNLLLQTGVGVPNQMMLLQVENKVNHYINQVHQRLEQLYPVAVIANNMKRQGENSLALQSNSLDHQDMLTFFNNNPHYEFNQMPVHQYLQENQDALQGVQNPELLKNNLQSLDRLTKLTTNDQERSALYTAGLHSAHSIAQMSPETFVQQHADAVGGTEAAANLHAKASRVSALAHVLLSAHQDNTTAATPRMVTTAATAVSATPMAVSASAMAPNIAPLPISTSAIAPIATAPAPSVTAPASNANTTVVGGTATDAMNHLPDWEDLFGPFALCECAECRSVYSPAAYLVDLLAFLNKNSALQELFSRRHDIGDVQMTCDNTNVLMPYVDLVNEILENTVSPSTAVSHPATTGTEAELSVSPQYINQGAYDALAQQVYPWTLPFNLWNATGRLFLGQKGVQRDRLMKAFQSAATQVSDLQIAAEYLHLSHLETQLILGQASNDQNQIFGIPAGTDLVQTLTPIQSFMQHTGLLYQEVVDLLAVPFVNAGGQIKLSSYTEADLTQVTITNLTADALKSIHVFVRLYLVLKNRFSWTIAELSVTMSTLKANGVTEQFLQQVTIIQQVKEQLRLPLVALLGFWSTIDTTSQLASGQSLYAQTFQNKAVLNPVDPIFQLNDSKTELANAGDSITNHRTSVAAGLGIQADDLAYLLANGVANTLNLATLSQLYRTVALAKALKLSVQDLTSLQALTGINPFHPNSLVDTLLFDQTVAKIRQSAFSLAELNELLRHVDNPQSPVGPTTASIANVLGSIRNSLNPQVEKITTLLQSTEPVDGTDFRSLVKTILGDALSLDSKVMDQLAQAIKSPDQPTESAVDSFWKPSFITKSADEVQNPLTAQQLIEKFPEQYHAYLLLYKIAMLFRKWQISDLELNVVLNNGPALGWIDFQSLPIAPVATSAALFGSWDTMNTLFSKRLSDGKPALYPTIKEALDSTQAQSGITEASVLTDLSQRMGWNLDDLTLLTGAQGFNLQFPSDFQNVSKLMNLQTCFDLLNRLGASVATALNWLTPDLTSAAAISMKETLKGLYDYDTWLQVAKPLQDQLRDKQRQALVDSLTATLGLTDSQLYDRFLIDVEMCSCQQTTRIKQAISSVQLFIQRSFMNLEQGVVLNTDAWSAWQWMKNYRVWEANRKVFLYPENWIEPELRTNKTPFFKNLEDALLQQEVTEGTAVDAFLNYLVQMDTITHLEICGFYLENAPDGSADGNILHVFGCTQDVPSEFFYRRFEAGVWTPWEQVDLDIQGQFVMPYVYNGRLYLFWTIIKDQAEQVTTVSNNNNGQASAPPTHKEIQLAWSEYKNGHWSPKKVSRDTMPGKANVAPFQVQSEQLYFLPTLSGINGDLIVSCYALNLQPQTWQNPPQGAGNLWQQTGTYLLSFRMSCSTGAVSVESIPSVQSLTLVVDNNMKYESMRIVGAENGQKLNFVGGQVTPTSNRPVSIQMLAPKQQSANGQDTPFTIVHPNEYAPFTSQSPFFFKDEYRTFFILPKKISAAPGLANYRYAFQTFYHPYIHEFMKALQQQGVDGLLTPASQNQSNATFFQQTYVPSSLFVQNPWPVENVDFSTQGSNSIYNWELFFHVPFLIANKLSKNQQFEEAQKWYHYIFNPTLGSGSTTTPSTYWRVAPFYNGTTGRSINQLLALLDYTGTDQGILQEKADLITQVQQWQQHPFDPQTIAQLRPTAYQKSIVMHYIDNLIAWGDSLFSQDTIESINEATLLYILAAEILGPRPVQIKTQDTIQPQSYNQLAPHLDAFSNALVQLENLLPAVDSNTQAVANAPQPILLNGALYFCTPQNDQLLKYWDTVGDRLFKIRNCMNIAGVVRQLPLFEPPIDPGLLVRAVAAGVDLSTVINSQNAKMPHYRFQHMLQKALELCGELKAYGASLLAALEKRDAEALALLRSTQEVQLLNAMIDVKKKAIDEASQNLYSLQRARDVINARYDYYKNIQYMSAKEKANLDLLASAQIFQVIAAATEVASSVAYAFPNITFGLSGAMGSPVSTTTLGGSNVGAVLQAVSRGLSAKANYDSGAANMSAIMAGYERRGADWKLQANLAELELKQNDQQILAAQIRLQMAEKELENLNLQISQAQSVNEFMHSKFTNRELYDWMIAQISTLFFQSYQLAYDLAKQAEKAFQFELATKSNFIQFGYWDSLKKGLLTGEKLYFDLKRMEAAYLDQNTREYEITKHISLGLLDPLALLQLKENGYCYVNITEDLFDRDYPGHYLRRLKSVSLTIPSVTGPYTNINCTLTLLQNSIRIQKDPGTSYLRDSNQTDARFEDFSGATESIVTSSGVNDHGLFELNFHDERYLPFEGSGAISQWRIELPAECNAFDVQTISDLVLHLNYTSRDGGSTLKQAAWNAVIKTTLAAESTPPTPGLTWSPLRRLFSAKHEFANAWNQFMYPPQDQTNQSFTINLTPAMFPYQFRNGQLQISNVQMFLLLKNPADYTTNGAQPLKLFLNLGTQPLTLEMGGGFASVPNASQALTAQIGNSYTLTITAEEANNIASISSALFVQTTGSDGKTVHYRLNPQAILDIGLLVTYSGS